MFAPDPAPASDITDLTLPARSGALPEPESLQDTQLSEKRAKGLRILDEQSDFIRQAVEWRMKDPHKAEDIYQDTMMRLIKAAECLADAEHVDRYLRVTVRNAVHNYNRLAANRSAYQMSQLHDGEGEPIPVESSEIDPAENAETGDQVVQLRKALDRIPELYRDTLRLALLEDRPYAEVAEILSVPLGTIKRRVHEGLKKLAKLMGADQE